MMGTAGSASRMSIPLSWHGVLVSGFSSLPSTASPSFFSSSPDDSFTTSSSSPSSDLSHLHLFFSLLEFLKKFWFLDKMGSNVKWWWWWWWRKKSIKNRNKKKVKIGTKMFINLHAVNWLPHTSGLEIFSPPTGVNCVNYSKNKS